MPKAWLIAAAFTFAVVAAPAAGAEPGLVPVGVASVDVTPKGPIRLTGYGGRPKESEGVASRLKARALAVGDDASGPAVLIVVDNCGVPSAEVEKVAARLASKGVTRERFTVSSTHTHCGPALRGNLPFILAKLPTTDEQNRIDRYTDELADAMERVAVAALADRKPAQLAWSKGSVGFAKNRRMLKDGKWTGFGSNPDGPVDHSLPVLRVSGPDGTTRAVLAGYACHCTTLGGTFNEICAEWAGYACDAIEHDNPGSVALVVIGCGADADPQPRRALADAETHGRALAAEVNRVLGGPMTPVNAPLTTRLRRIALPFAAIPTRAQFAARTTRPGSEGMYARYMVERLERGEKLPRELAYPVQVWSFGTDLALVFLGGEVVVDYARRLAAECDASRLWVVAYSNDVPCYIASKRVLQEGGYEADASMVYYGQPTRLAPEAEDRIIETVRGLLPKPIAKR
jgi:hypothetical protein